jgi:dephospho-CoA kinase
MKIIGLCGGSGSGKGTVAEIFSVFGIPSVDTDKVYHELTSRKSDCLDALVSEFGEAILNDKGTLDRKALSALVFGDGAAAVKRQSLNKITHKFVLDRTREILRDYELMGAKAALVDAPLLFESDFDKECDLIIAVVADMNIRIDRIMLRDGITERSATLRVKTQLPDDYLSSRADYIINNSGSLDELEKAVSDIAYELLK